MKALLMTAVLALSTHVFAADKTLVYCDYNAATPEQSLYMDLYFDFDATANTYSNLEVGFLNPENQGYPDYLYTVTSTIVENGTDAQVTAAKDANTVNFSLPATAVSINGVLTPNYQVTTTDGKVNGFDVVATGTFNGQDLSAGVTFTCYDPAMLNNQVPQQPR
jgi:hypothetical protein